MSLWLLLVPAGLFAGVVFVGGLTFGGALFQIDALFVTFLWVAVWSLPFVIWYALNYTRKYPKRLMWAAVWVWVIVGLFVIMTVISSGVLT